MKERTATIAYFGTPYCVLLGVAYLWPYWSAFGIDILEFLSVADIFRLAAYPLFLVSLVAAASSVFGLFVPLLFNKNPEASFRLKLAGPRLGAVFVVWLLAIWLSIQYVPPVYIWAALAVLVGLPVSLEIRELVLRAGFSGSASSAASLLLGVLPFLVSGTGAANAELVKRGLRFSLVASKIEGLPDFDERPVEEWPRYLGHAGEKYFLWLPKSRSIVIVDKENAKTLRLVRIPRVDSPPSLFIQSPASSASRANVNPSLPSAASASSGPASKELGASN